VSTPKNILWEGRFIVDGTNIIAHPTYQFGGLVTKIPSVPKESLAFCKTLLTVDYKPDRLYCLDICQGKDKEYYLMELTSFSCAGWYAMNKMDIVREVSKIAIAEYKS